MTSSSVKSRLETLNMVRGCVSNDIAGWRPKQCITVKVFTVIAANFQTVCAFFFAGLDRVLDNY